MAQLLDRVRDEGGSGIVLQVLLTDPAQRQQLIRDFRQASDAEYEDLLGRVPAFLAELATERDRGRISLVEAEENEVDLQHYRSWLTKTQARDYLQAPVGQTALRELERCVSELARFDHEAVETETAAATPAQRHDTPQRP